MDEASQSGGGTDAGNDQGDGTGSGDEAYGVDAFVWGLKLVFGAYAVFVVLRLLGPASAAFGASSGAGPYSSEAGAVVLVLVLIGLLVALFLGLFFAVFLFVALHHVEVVLSSSASASADAPAWVADSQQYSTGAEVPVTPELFFPPEVAWIGPFLPPALLLLAGFLEYRLAGDVVGATKMVVIGYAMATAIVILPVSWVFNAIVGPFLASLLSSAYTDATLEVHVENLLRAHVLVGLVYPAIFGGVGAVVAEVTGVGVGSATGADDASDGASDDDQRRRKRRRDPDADPLAWSERR